MSGEVLLAQTQAAMNKLYSVKDCTEKFSIQPAVQQRLEDEMLGSNRFLSLISNHLREQLKGQKVLMGVNGPISRRTPNRGPRRPTDPLRLKQLKYSMEYIERDVELAWTKVDSWGGSFKDFYKRFRRHVIHQRSNDILMTGWNGQFYEETTDPEVFTKLQDNNVGWIQHMINVCPDNVLGLKPDGSIDPIKVGEGGDFLNFEELVNYLLNDVISELHSERDDMSAIMGRELRNLQRATLYKNHGGHTGEPTQNVLLDQVISQNTIAGCSIVQSAHFPLRSIMVTPLENISRYVQKGTARAKGPYDDHETKAIKDMLYQYESFQIEEVEACGVVHPDAILIKNEKGNWAKMDKPWAAVDPTADSGSPLDNILNAEEQEAAG